MQPTIQQKSIRANARYITSSTHYNKRKFDKKFEIVARLPDAVVDELELNFGGYVVLDVANTQREALELVKFYRGHVTQ